MDNFSKTWTIIQLGGQLDKIIVHQSDIYNCLWTIVHEWYKTHLHKNFNQYLLHRGQLKDIFLNLVTLTDHIETYFELVIRIAQICGKIHELVDSVADWKTQHNDETGSSDRHDFVVTVSDNEENIDPIVVAKKRGRPAGSKNKRKDQSTGSNTHKRKRQKLDDSSEIQFLKGRSYTYSERVLISLQLLKLEKNQELTNFHITEFQNLIYKKYNVQGLFIPDYYTLKNAPFNPEIIHESIFIHVLHAENHWIVLANLHPTYEDLDILITINTISVLLKWSLKDSRVALDFFVVVHVNVTKQKGNKDCGLFALGYALSLAMNLDPAIDNRCILCIEKTIIAENNKIRIIFLYRKPLPSILGINLKFNRNSIWNSSHRNHVKN
ncbi:hypothetical protein BpHYR1_018019 [Brachionus plicatilis]|uniref:Ubiquitin-like protease family profile domain-containing protein n=1 Tax=Brachionus plicatilis TaxID=10195 RepID=A0A3M7PBB5_BRAPC|nr:hypothetical protein BpHYR1_018019 [Brachionus plicatilis]